MDEEEYSDYDVAVEQHSGPIVHEHPPQWIHPFSLVWQTRIHVGMEFEGFENDTRMILLENMAIADWLAKPQRHEP